MPLPRPALPSSRLLLVLALLLLPLAAGAVLIEQFGADGGPGEDGAAATAGGVEEVAGDEAAILLVRAWGGRGGDATTAGDPAGDGGDGFLEGVAAVSESGLVDARGDATGGAGGAGSELAPAGDGGDVQLHDAVEGRSSGDVHLRQRALAGAAGAGAGGRGGAAASHLARSVSAAALDLEVWANGGEGSTPPPRSQDTDTFGGPGGSAVASSRASNDAGPVLARVMARGGNGALSGVSVPGAPGGDARVFASALGEGDGGAVEVGEVVPPPDEPYPHGRFAGAFGGGGGAFQPSVADGPSPPGGPGGAATSFSLGVARGERSIAVHDLAVGGVGGAQRGDAAPVAPGGEASSLAVAISSGHETVLASAHARGGSPGIVWQRIEVPLAAAPPSSAPETGFAPGGAGAANADAHAHGAGEVRATADAIAGRGPRLPTPETGVSLRSGAAARAGARAHGDAGDAEAGAESHSTGTRLALRAVAEGDRSVVVRSEVGPEAGLALRCRTRRGRRGFTGFLGHDAVSTAQVSPDASSVASAIAASPGLAVTLAAAGVVEFPAQGCLKAAARPPAGWRTLTRRFEIELATERFWDEAHWLVLLAPVLVRPGFERLVVRLEKEQQILEEHVFDDAPAARAYLDGAMFPVGVLGLTFLLPSPPLSVPPGSFDTPAEPFSIFDTPPAPWQPLRGVDFTREGDFGRRVIVLGRSERARLVVELTARGPAARFELGFLVGTAPFGAPPSP